MKKGILLLAAAFLISISGCTSSNRKVEGSSKSSTSSSQTIESSTFFTDDSSTETANTEQSSEPAESVPLKGTKINDPANTGEIVGIDVMDSKAQGGIGINVVLFSNGFKDTSIEDILLGENQFNDVAPEGWTWIVAATKLVYVDDNMDDDSAFVSATINTDVIVDGVIQENYSIVCPDFMDNHIEVYNKKPIERYFPVLIPQDYANREVIIRFSSLFGDEYAYYKVSELKELEE